MSADLRVFVGFQGCFSSIFVEHTILLKRRHSDVICHAIKENIPYILGIAQLPSKQARTFTQHVIEVFDQKETLYGGQSTTLYGAEVSWLDMFSGRQTSYCSTSELPLRVYRESFEQGEIRDPALKAVLANPETYINWTHSISLLSKEFLQPLFPDASTLWTKFSWGA